MERLGLVGLPNAGKSSLFNALTGGSTPVAPHPFSTTETTEGVALVPDHRVEALAAMSRSRKTVHVGVGLVDVAGLVAGASTGEGLGNRFLSGIRETDALCYVLRAFDDQSIPGQADPVAAAEVLQLELVLADLASVEGVLERRRKAARSDKTQQKELDALEAARRSLDAGLPIYRAGLDGETRAGLRDAFLLTDKPVLAVINLGEDQLDRSEDLAKAVSAELGEGSPVLGVSVQLEAEAAQLAPSEREELLRELGLGEGVLPRVARAAYQTIGRRTFLTTGEKESRAWTFRAGAKAPECAGVIHSDLQRGFIRAEVIAWDELLELGAWASARAAGKLRVEGKEYEVQDGDVLEIRFNV